MSTVTALEVQQRNKERVNVYLDGEYAFSLTLIAAAQLRKGQELDSDAIETLRSDDAVQRAVDHAARFLSYRPRSEAEVRQNLAQNQYPPVAVDAAIERLTAMGYLDDAAFARFWVENRDTFKPRGPLALRYELRQKGVAGAIIDEALAGFDSEDAAFRAAQDRATRLRGSSRQVVRHKLGSFLQRRGFDHRTCLDVIHQLFEQIDAEDPDFLAADSSDEDAP